MHSCSAPIPKWSTAHGLHRAGLTSLPPLAVAAVLALVSYRPGAQGTFASQYEDWGRSWYFPAGQVGHSSALDPGLSVYRPAGHARHSASPGAGWWEPAAHATHADADAAPATAPCRPAEQFVHDAADGAAGTAEKRPAAQSAHAKEGAVKYLPGPHAVHAVAPGIARVSVTEPGGQAVQSAWPVRLLYVSRQYRRR